MKVKFVKDWEGVMACDILPVAMFLFKISLLDDDILIAHTGYICIFVLHNEAHVNCVV